MAEHSLIIVLWSVILLTIISISIQGWLVMHQDFGYRKDPQIPPTNNHPEMEDYKMGDQLLVLKFKDEYDRLLERAEKMKIDQLFDEPSTYEDELEDGSDY